MNPANYREALIETRADESEGADILLVSIFVLYLSMLCSIDLSEELVCEL